MLRLERLLTRRGFLREQGRRAQEDQQQVRRYRNRDRSGFTLTELLVVVLVLTILAGILYPALAGTLRGGKRQQAERLVQAVVAAIASRESRSTTLSDGAVRWLWDFNGDGLIDGKTHDDALPDRAEVDPAFAGQPASVEAASISYNGFFQDSGLTLPENLVDDHARVVDPWGRPLRIIIDGERFPIEGFGVWSAGPDGLPLPGGSGTPEQHADDVRSWSVSQ